MKMSLTQNTMTCRTLTVSVLTLLASLLTFPALAQLPGAASMPPPKTFIDYFLTTPPHGDLSRDAWGATNVLPRDPENGLEDTTIKEYCYWDGQIIKAADGKYHLFASRWSESRGHGSKVIVIPFDGAGLDRDLQSSTGSSKQ
jgi:hypothetical protein